MCCHYRIRNNNSNNNNNDNNKSNKPPCERLCGKKGESVQHITSGCETLAQKKYKRRHGNYSKKVHWDICKNNRLEHSEKWYEHGSEGAVENEDIKVLLT